MVDKRLSDSDIKLLLQGFRSKGISEPVIELAKKDLEYGLPKDMVDLYSIPAIGEANAKAMSEALHLGASSKLVKKFKKLNEYQMKLALAELKGGMSEDNIISVVTTNATAHDMERMFTQIKKDMSGAKPDKAEDAKQPDEVMESSTDGKPIPIQPAAINADEIVRVMEPIFERFAQGIVEAMRPNRESLDEVAGMIKNWESQMAESKNREAENRLNEELDCLEKQVAELKSDLASSAGVIKSKEEEISRLREEMLTMKEHQTAEREEPVREQKPNQTSEGGETNRKSEEKPIMQTSGTAVYGNCQTMLRAPDGTMIPVHIERTEAKRPQGVAAMAAKLFGGTPSQKSLLSMLIEGRLDKEQLKEIKRAKDHHFSDDEIKDLIECGLPAEEMAGIINVVMSDRILQ